MKFSIVIPNLNSPIIDQTINALLNQSSPDFYFEIIVVGLDQPHLVKESAIVHFISTNKPVSPGMARSIGCKQATGEILCFLDADCIPCADWLQQIEKRFRDLQIDVLGGGVECKDNGFWVRCEYISSFHDYLVTAPAKLCEQLPSLNLIIRRSVFEEVGGFDETMAGGEDADLTLRLRKYGYALHFDPRISVDHRPNRRTARAVLRRTWWYAYHSMKVDQRWQCFLDVPVPLRHHSILLLMSPLLAFAVTVSIYRGNHTLWSWWYMAPFIYVLKIVWCFAAVRRLLVRPF